MATVLITGGTGMIGTALVKALRTKGYETIILTRRLPSSKESMPGVSYAVWDVENQTIDKTAITSADHIIHLAGANVGEKRWTDKRKKEIIVSRTMSSTLLVEALRKNENKVKTVVSASAIGWYIPNSPEVLAKDKAWKGRKEDEQADESFLGDATEQWEASIETVTSLGKRLVKLRT